jgi:hypothetical protein
MTRPVSYAPIVLALGVMLALWAIASTWVVSVVLVPLGLFVIALGAARWRKEARR